MREAPVTIMSSGDYNNIRGKFYVNLFLYFASKGLYYYPRKNCAARFHFLRVTRFMKRVQIFCEAVAVYCSDCLHIQSLQTASSESNMSSGSRLLNPDSLNYL